MRAMLLSLLAYACLGSPAAALSVCPISEFSVAFPPNSEEVDQQSLEILRAAVNRSRICNTPRFVIATDGVGHHGPARGFAVQDALEALGVDAEALRVDLLTANDDRWTDALARHGVSIVIYFGESLPVRPPEPMRCFDVALVAKVLSFDADAQPITNLDDNAIILRWPWRLSLEVEDVLVGQAQPRSLNVWMTLHTRWRHEVNHVLFFLQRNANGDYVVVGADTRVVSDRRSRFILPIAHPLESFDLQPQSWVPSSYQQFLRPVHYHASDAWWLSSEIRDSLEPLPNWTMRRGDFLVALRGIYASDLAPMLEPFPQLQCAAETERAQ